MSKTEELVAKYENLLPSLLSLEVVKLAVNEALEWAAEQCDSRDLCDHCRDAEYAGNLIRAGKSKA